MTDDEFSLYKCIDELDSSQTILYRYLANLREKGHTGKNINEYDITNCTESCRYYLRRLKNYSEMIKKEF